MTNAKNANSEDFARISLDGLSANPSDQVAGQANDSKAPLCDEYGRLITVLASGSTPVGADDYYEQRYWLPPRFGVGQTYNIRPLIGIQPVASDLLEFSGAYISGGTAFIHLFAYLGAGPPVLGNTPTASIRVTNGSTFSLSYPSNIPRRNTPFVNSFTQSLWAAVSSTATSYTPLAAGQFFCQALIGQYPN